MAEKPNTETRSKLFLERKTPLKKLRSPNLFKRQFKQMLPLATAGVFVLHTSLMLVYFYRMLLHPSPSLPDGMPQRIVSLVPSQTELLYNLGLESQVAGITKFCIHPPHWRKSKVVVGGTKSIHPHKIDALQPDLIIANKEENVKEQVEALAQRYRVYVSDISTLQDAIKMMEDIGKLTHTEATADKIITAIRNNFESLRPQQRIRTAYLVWRNPWMTVGGDTFIHDMLKRAGLDNIYADKKRYPVITMEDLSRSNCELLLLSSEPYPFQQKHINELQHLLPGTLIVLADGEMFSWYGSRLLHAPDYYKQLLQSF